MVAFSGFVMTAVTITAEAKRFGGGFSSGRQSVNVMQQRQAVTPPVASAPKAAGAAGAAGTAASGSRWLGPLAGLAAGLGLAALLAHFGFGGAMADLLVLALIAGIAIFGIRFMLNALRGGLDTAAQGAAGSGLHRRQYSQDAGQRAAFQTEDSQRPPLSGLLGPGPMHLEQPQPLVGDFFIPADFDQQGFLQEAKNQFMAVQKAWDAMDFDGLQSRLTDELYAEYAGKMAAHGGNNMTEVVLLNADLLGIEKLTNGHLASVRFSGMIREDGNPEAVAFEEAWNLYKPDGKGWLLAGIQQLASS
jgi:predicted lipid-binding transport protein (Tim44 family)